MRKKVRNPHNPNNTHSRDVACTGQMWPCRAMSDARPQFRPRPKHLQVVRARAPQDFCDRVKMAAQSEGVPTSEFIRRSIADRISARGGPPQAA
jgi:hypothetical protein